MSVDDRENPSDKPADESTREHDAVVEALHSETDEPLPPRAEEIANRDARSATFHQRWVKVAVARKQLRVVVQETAVVGRLEEQMGEHGVAGIRRVRVAFGAEERQLADTSGAVERGEGVGDPGAMLGGE